MLGRFVPSVDDQLLFCLAIYNSVVEFTNGGPHPPLQTYVTFLDLVLEFLGIRFVYPKIFRFGWEYNFIYEVFQ
ncbi:hypothetical protein L6452_11405 [Arctium lappa]|uniref:Uncharacterized protein n=1 Tax=Arctium lappa TaxID=4217 RepID=A0ACB9DQ06_ARCLA|nr:hypothetical protein L6452_11405 [Arctium lappa]